MTKLASLITVGVLCCAAALSAQAPVRLGFEILKNDAVIGSPEVSISEGTEGRISITRAGDARFTPTLRNPDTLSLAFVISADGKEIKPTLTLQREAGSIRWQSGADAYALRISWKR